MRSSLFNLLVYLVLYIFLFISCSSSQNSIYGTDHQLSNEKILVDGLYYINVPVGFFIPENNIPKGFEFWLMNRDYNSSLSLVKINIDSPSKAAISENPLKHVLTYSKTLRRAEIGNSFSSIGKEEYFSLNNIEFAASEYIGKDGLPIRLVVFKYQNNFYELSASITNRGLSGDEISYDLYSAQNALLSSISK